MLAGPQGTDVVEKSFYYQIVISASHQLGGRSKEDIQQEVLKELAEVWPETANAILLHSRQVTEHRAVFSPVPESMGSALPNSLL